MLVITNNIIYIYIYIYICVCMCERGDYLEFTRADLSSKWFIALQLPSYWWGEDNLCLLTQKNHLKPNSCHIQPPMEVRKSYLSDRKYNSWNENPRQLFYKYSPPPQNKILYKVYIKRHYYLKLSFTLWRK